MKFKVKAILRSRTFQNQTVSVWISIPKRVVCLRPNAFLWVNLFGVQINWSKNRISVSSVVSYYYPIEHCTIVNILVEHQVKLSHEGEVICIEIDTSITYNCKKYPRLWKLHLLSENRILLSESNSTESSCECQYSLCTLFVPFTNFKG